MVCRATAWQKKTPDPFNSPGPTDVSWDRSHGDDQERSDERSGGRREISRRNVLCLSNLVKAINSHLFVSVEYLRQNRKKAAYHGA
jgi:hypothetical protein